MQLWDRLSNESGRAYEAFKVYMFMSPAERSVVGAWREWTENPEAVRPSPFFEGWSREHAWVERARAHDAHLDRLRESSIEKVIQQEAERQARVVEQMRYRFAEMMTLMYEKAITNLEESEYWESMRPQDVINVVRLHLESYVKLEEMMPQQEAAPESDWDERHDAELDRIMGEIEAQREEEAPEPNEFGDDEGDSEESEGEQD